MEDSWNVYAIMVKEMPGSCVVKIGCTRKDVEVRMSEISVSEGDMYTTRPPIKVIHVVEDKTISYIRKDKPDLIREKTHPKDRTKVMEASGLEQAVLEILSDAGIMCPEEFHGLPGASEIFEASNNNWNILKEHLRNPNANEEAVEFLEGVFRSLYLNRDLEYWNEKDEAEDIEDDYEH